VSPKYLMVDLKKKKVVRIVQKLYKNCTRNSTLSQIGN
jgi:hypothetical protein